MAKRAKLDAKAKMNSITLFVKSINLFNFATGGIYCIRCLKNNKIYIGETSSLLERASRHFSLLKNGYHECLSLQKDFCFYGSACFKFEILYVENTIKKCRALEQKVIKKQSVDQCYNKVHNGFQKKLPQLAQQISIKGQVYDSIRQAEKHMNISKATLVRKLNDTKNTDSIRLKKQPICRGKYNFLIEEVCYSFTNQVVEHQLEKNDAQVRDRCRSKNWRWVNWRMIQKKRFND